MVTSSRKSQVKGAKKEAAAPSPQGATPGSPQRAKKQALHPVHVDASASPANGKSHPPRGKTGKASAPSYATPSWLPYVLVGLSLLGAFFLGAKVGNVPQMQLLNGSSTQQSSSSGGGLPQGKKVVSESSGIFPRGCKWREVYYEVRQVLIRVGVCF